MIFCKNFFLNFSKEKVQDNSLRMFCEYNLQKESIFRSFVDIYSASGLYYKNINIIVSDDRN